MLHSLSLTQDGSVDHREFALFMQQLDVEISKKQLSKLISIVDPRSHGKVSKTSLMYWLFPEEQLKISMSIGEKIGLSLARDSGQPV